MPERGNERRHVLIEFEHALDRLALAGNRDVAGQQVDVRTGALEGVHAVAMGQVAEHRSAKGRLETRVVEPVLADLGRIGREDGDTEAIVDLDLDHRRAVHQGRNAGLHRLRFVRLLEHRGILADRCRHQSGQRHAKRILENLRHGNIAIFGEHRHLAHRDLAVHQTEQTGRQSDQDQAEGRKVAGKVEHVQVSGLAQSLFDVANPCHRVFHPPDGDDFHAGDRLLRAIGFRNQRPGEAELGSLLEALLSAWRRTDLTRQTNFTKYNKFRWQRFVF